MKRTDEEKERLRIKLELRRSSATTPRDATKMSRTRRKWREIRRSMEGN